MSPLLFNLYSEVILDEALEDTSEEININGERINNIRYADDTVLLAESAENLQALLERVNIASNHYGLKMNTRKTKVMIISKQKNINEQLTLGSEAIELVRQYKYLGTWLNDQLDFTQECRVRIERARAAFVRLQKLLTNRSLNLDVRIRMVRCYVFPILLYGLEDWTFNKALEAGSL